MCMHVRSLLEDSERKERKFSLHFDWCFWTETRKKQIFLSRRGALLDHGLASFSCIGKHCLASNFIDLYQHNLSGKLNKKQSRSSTSMTILDQWRSFILTGRSLTRSNLNIFGSHTWNEFISTIYFGREANSWKETNTLFIYFFLLLDRSWFDYLLYWSICILVNIDWTNDRKKLGYFLGVLFEDMLHFCIL